MGRVFRLALFALVLCLALVGAVGAQEPPIPAIPELATPTPQPTPPREPAPPVPQPPPAPERAPSQPVPPAEGPPVSSADAAVRAVSGMGMYVWRWERTGGVDDVVRRARDGGLSFLVVRASSASQGFYLAPILAELLPKAHAAGLKVVAYDPPRLEDIEADVRRAHELVNFRSAGHSIDAFAADIEPRWELATPQNVDAYGARLRQAVGAFPLVGVVYPPNQFGDRFPFAEVARHFDVLSPMSYWRAVTIDAPGFIDASVRGLAGFGKPVSVVGQAFSYDTHRDPALRGHPPRPEFDAAIAAARAAGAVGMSYWVWEHAEPWVFDSIRTAGWTGASGAGLGVRPPAALPLPPPGVAVDAGAQFHEAAAEHPRRTAAAGGLEAVPWSARPLASAALLAALALLTVDRRRAIGTVALHVPGVVDVLVAAAERGAAPFVAAVPTRCRPRSGPPGRGRRSAPGEGSGRRRGRARSGPA